MRGRFDDPVFPLRRCTIQRSSERLFSGTGNDATFVRGPTLRLPVPSAARSPRHRVICLIRADSIHALTELTALVPPCSRPSRSGPLGAQSARSSARRVGEQRGRAAEPKHGFAGIKQKRTGEETHRIGRSLSSREFLPTKVAEGPNTLASCFVGHCGLDAPVRCASPVYICDLCL